MLSLQITPVSLLRREDKGAPGRATIQQFEIPTDFSFYGHASHSFLRDGDENIPFEVLRASLATIFTPNPGVRSERKETAGTPRKAILRERKLASGTCTCLVIIVPIFGFYRRCFIFGAFLRVQGTCLSLSKTPVQNDAANARMLILRDCVSHLDPRTHSFRFPLWFTWIER